MPATSSDDTVGKGRVRVKSFFSLAPPSAGGPEASSRGHRRHPNVAAIRVYGNRPSEYIGVAAGFGPDGDRQGWTGFLAAAGRIFTKYGDIPFVHWAAYEKIHVKQYIDRYGDPDGVAARVLRNLVDLLPITKNAIALPLPSYSLKVVEGLSISFR